jgi:protein-S-isoprenylcysteine O-methyltransferase Ste14
MNTHVSKQSSAKSWLPTFALIYGVVCYLIFFGTTLYAIGFIGDFFVPKTIDAGPDVPPLQAGVIDIALLALFALQHSVMARPAFKRWWKRFVAPPLERSTYVLLASLALLLLFWLWLPLRGTIWNIQHPIGQALVLSLYGFGWLIAFSSTYLIDHFDLFGLRQVYTNWRATNYSAMSFKTPAFYRLVRHPLMTGFLIAFWAAPHMTVGRLLFALAMTGYILVGIRFEERDLLTSFGAKYRRYQEQVRMLIPFPKRSSAHSTNE